MPIYSCTYGLGQPVYLKSDPEQSKRFITEVIFQSGGSVLYTLSSGTVASMHYQEELSEEQDMSMKLDIAQKKESK